MQRKRLSVLFVILIGALSGPAIALPAATAKYSFSSADIDPGAGSQLPLRVGDQTQSRLALRYSDLSEFAAPSWRQSDVSHTGAISGSAIWSVIFAGLIMIGFGARPATRARRRLAMLTAIVGR